jgi:hypothetical protein
VNKHLSEAISNTAQLIQAAEHDPLLRFRTALAAEQAIELATLSSAESGLASLREIDALCAKVTWLEFLRALIVLEIDCFARGLPRSKRIADGTPIDLETCLTETQYDVWRASLRKESQRTVPSVSWVKAWMRHPAFDDVVPMARSFYEDQRFDSHLLQLVHEVTHVMSLRGAVGFTITILRMTLLQLESIIWRTSWPQFDDGFELAFLSAGGLAPLPPGDLRLLSAVETTCSVALKLKLFQEVWRPLLEGLAVFAECGADPSGDPVVIDDVSLCIRNLFDVDLEAKNVEDVREAHQAFVLEFDAIVSAAIRSRGPIRLESYLIDDDRVYFCGYVAVRAIASRLRATAQRPLSATQIFRLLLHAIKYATYDYIPEMEQSPDAFFEQALERMKNFVRAVSGLSKDSIEAFLTPPATPEGVTAKFHWEKGKLTLTGSGADDDDALSRRLSAWLQYHYVKALVPEHGTENYGEQATWDVATNGAYLRKVLTTVKRSQLLSWLDQPEFATNLSEIFRTLESDNALLPIGSGTARFWIRCQDNAHRILTLLVPSGGRARSVGRAHTLLHISLTDAEADAIETHHAKTGMPHMQIDRVAVCDDRYFGLEVPLFLHVLYIRYGQWRRVEGCADVGQSLLEESDQGRLELCDALQRRLEPLARARIEREILSTGESRSAAAANWLENSPVWHHGTNTPDASAWVEGVRRLAHRAIDPEERIQATILASATLLDAVFGDVPGIATIVKDGFDGATHSSPGRRTDIAGALFTSAFAPAQSSHMSKLSQHFKLGSQSLFSVTEHGMDVLPALVDEKDS